MENLLPVHKCVLSDFCLFQVCQNYVFAPVCMYLFSAVDTFEKISSVKTLLIAWTKCPISNWAVLIG